VQLQYDDVIITGVSTPLSTSNTKGIFGIKKAIITVSGADIRFKVDQTDPTPVSGHKLYDGDVCVLEDDEIPCFRAIVTGSTNATLGVTLKYR
jgi:hypothetical protein